jgi:hypothetical protein
MEREAAWSERRHGARDGQRVNCRRQAYRPARRAAGRDGAGRGWTGAVAGSGRRSAASPQATADGHRFPGPCLCGQYAGAALVPGAELARSRHRRRDGRGDGQGRRRWRDLRVSVFYVPIRRQLCGRGAESPSRPVRAGQAGRPGRSGGGRCHRRVEKDAGHGRYPHHHDEGSQPRPGRPGPRPDLPRGGEARFSDQYPVLGKFGSCSGEIWTPAPL